MMDYLNGHIIQIGEDLLLVNRNEKDENSKPTWEVSMFDLKTRSDKVETYERKWLQKAPFFIKGFSLNRSEIVLLYRDRFHIYNVENNKRSVILNLNSEEILDFIFFKGNMIYIKKGCMSIFRSSATGKKNMLLTLRAQPLSMGFSEQKKILTILANNRLFFLKIMKLKDKSILIRNTNISIPFKNRKTKYVYHSHKNLSYQNKGDYKEIIHVCSYLSNCIVLTKHLKRGTKCNEKQFLKLTIEEFRESQIKRVFFFEINEAAMEKENECSTNDNADIVDENHCELTERDTGKNNIMDGINDANPSSTDVLEVHKEENNTLMCGKETTRKVTNGDQSEQGNASTAVMTPDMTTEYNSCNENNMIDLKEETDTKWKYENESQGLPNIQCSSDQRMKIEEQLVKRENISEDSSIRSDIHNDHIENGIKREHVEHKREEEMKDKTIADMSKLYLAVCSNHGKMLIYYIGPMDAEHIESDFTQCEKKPLLSLQLTNNVFDVKDVTAVLRQRTSKQLNVIKKKKKKSKKFNQYVEYMNNKSKCLWNYSFFQWFYLSGSGAKVYTVQIPNSVILEALDVRIKEKEEAAKEGRAIEEVEKTMPLHLVDCDNKLIAIQPIENKLEKQNMIKEIMKKSNFSYCSDSDSYIESDISWKESDSYSIDSFSTEPDAIDLTTDKDPMYREEQRTEPTVSTVSSTPTVGGFRSQDVSDMLHWDLRIKVKKEPVSEDEKDKEQEERWVVSNDAQQMKMEEKSFGKNIWEKKNDSDETDETEETEETEEMSAESKYEKENQTGSDTPNSSVAKKESGSLLCESIAPLGNNLKTGELIKRVESEEHVTDNEKGEEKVRITTEMENANEGEKQGNSDWEEQKKINTNEEEEEEEEENQNQKQNQSQNQKLFSVSLNENKIDDALSTFKINTNYSNSKSTCSSITGMSNPCSLDTVSPLTENSENLEKLKKVDTSGHIKALKKEMDIEIMDTSDEIGNEKRNEKGNMERENEDMIKVIKSEKEKIEREDEEMIKEMKNEKENIEREDEEMIKEMKNEKGNMEREDQEMIKEMKDEKGNIERENEERNKEVGNAKKNEKGEKEEEEEEEEDKKNDKETENSVKGNTKREDKKKMEVEKNKETNVVAEKEVEKETNIINPVKNVKGEEEETGIKKEKIKNNKNDNIEMKEKSDSTDISKEDIRHEENENIRSDSEESVCSKRKRKIKLNEKDEKVEKDKKVEKDEKVEKEKRKKEKEKKKKKMKIVTEEACISKIKNNVEKDLDDSIEKKDSGEDTSKDRSSSEYTEKKKRSSKEKENKGSDKRIHNKKNSDGKNKKGDNNESDEEDKNKYKEFPENCKNDVDNEKKKEKKMKKSDSGIEQQKKTHKENNEITSKEKMEREENVNKLNSEKENKKKRKKEIKEENKTSDINEKEKKKKKRRKLEEKCVNEILNTSNISEKECDLKVSEQKSFEVERSQNDRNEFNMHHTKDYMSVIGVIKSSLGLMDKVELEEILKIKDNEVIRKTVKHLGKKYALKLFDYIVFILSEKNRLVIDYFFWIVAICNIYKKQLKGKKYTGLVAKFQFLVNHCIKMQPAVTSVIDKIKSILQRFEENEITDNTQILNYTDGTVKQ